MGITEEIVRSVFAKHRSVHRHDAHRYRATVVVDRVEKKRWRPSVISYLCGDQECSSVRSSAVAEVGLGSFRSSSASNITVITTCGGGGVTWEGQASVSSSEATVDQPLCRHNAEEEKHNSTSKLFRRDDAALIIQTAFRAFRQAKCYREGANILGKASPSMESVSTSVEVQTGNSLDIFSIKDEISYSLRPAIRHRAKAQVQEDWDDSTVSSAISKTRIQNRLEAATRRERALAYAFSQQLKICSKRKQSAAEGDEINTGWSWLERWMAARQPEDNTRGISKTVMRKKMLDASGEEKESCGSNEMFEAGGMSSVPNNVPRPSKSRGKGTRRFSGQSSRSSHLCPRESKSMKKVCHVEDKKETRKRAKHPPGNKGDSRNASSIIQA